MRSEFDLNVLPARERYDFWRDVSQSLHVPVGVSCERPESFSARYDGRHLGRFAVGSAFISVEHRVSRTPQHIRRSSDDMVGVWLPLTGGILMHQDGRDAHIRPGQLGVVDPARPYEELTFDDFNFLWIQLPREDVEAKIGSTKAITSVAFTPEEPRTRLAIEYLNSLSRVWDTIAGTSAEQAAGYACTLLALAFDRQKSASRGADAADPELQMLRIKSFLNKHLADSDLSSEMAGCALGITAHEVERIARLHNMEFAQYVLKTRLMRCAQMLADPRFGAYSTADIASMNGVPHAERFHKAFAETYAMSPDDYRAARQ